MNPRDSAAAWHATVHDAADLQPPDAAKACFRGVKFAL
jgi:hypothetical protein